MNLNRCLLPGLLLVGFAVQAEVLYEDTFDNDGLALNAKTGGGASDRSIEGASWTDGGDASFGPSGPSTTRHAILYSNNTFQSATGFRLTVRYLAGSAGSHSSGGFSFGLASSDMNPPTYNGGNPFRNEPNLYSVGVNLTEQEGAAVRGLNFSNGTTSTPLDASGTHAQFKAGETSEVTIEIGLGGYWCYRIDGVYEASGVLIDGFDLTKSFRIVAYARDDAGGAHHIQSIKLETGYAQGERAKGVRGTWAGGDVVWQVKDFKTLDTIGVGFNSGATQSALHFAPQKLLESLWQGDTDANGNPINLLVPLWGDLNSPLPENDPVLDRILETRAAGFKVKGYSNCENLVGTNAAEYEGAVARWKAYCDTDPNVQAFINSQPFHTGVWNRSTSRYEVAYNMDGTEKYPNRKYMFCYAEYVLKDYGMRYGPLIGAWIFDSAADIEANGDSATSGLIAEQRIYQAFANAVHAGNPDIPLAFNNGRSTVNYASYPFAHATRYDDFTFGHAFGGNNNHADKVGNQFNLNYRHVTRMVSTNGYVHAGGSWTWDDGIVGNFHSKLSTTSWSDGPIQAWEEADFLQWNLEALQAGGSMTWGGSTQVTYGEEQLRPWAYNLLKALDDHLARHQSPGAPNWARYHTVLPKAVYGQAYYHVLVDGKDFWDPEGDRVSMISPVNGAPSWLNIAEDPLHSGRWILSGIPTESVATRHSFSLRAMDIHSLHRDRDVVLEINDSSTTIPDPGNGTPVWAANPLPLADAYRYKEYEYLLTRGREFEDFDRDALEITLFGGPSWLVLEKVAPDVWKLAGIPGSSDSGINTALLTLSDGRQTRSTILRINGTDDPRLDMSLNSINGGAYWSNLGHTAKPGSLTYNNRSKNFDYRALMYSTRAFQSDGGFRLRVNYTTGSIGDVLGHNFSFGLISSDSNPAGYTGLNPFRTDTSVYSLGVNLCSAGDSSARGLNFTNGSSRTTLDTSGTHVQFVVGTSTEVVIEIRPDGAWSYWINGVNEASGVIPGGFDLTKSYHVAFYGQDDDGGGKSIQSMALDLIDVPTPSLVAAWNFDSVNSPTILDTTTNSFDGTAANGILTSGVTGQAMSFNGSNSSVTIPAGVFSSVHNEVTISMWANGSSTQPRADTTFSAQDASGNRVINIHLPWSSSSVIWDAGNSGGASYDRISKTAKVPEFRGRWNHWVFTKNATSGEMKIYLNGKLWHSSLLQGTNNKFRTMGGIQRASLGSAHGTSVYAGKIDDVKIFNYAMTGSDVSELYHAYQGYHTWLTRYIDLEDAKLHEDQDGDNLPALLEYVLNGDIHTHDRLQLPTMQIGPDGYIFKFTRRSESAEDTTQIFQYGSNLVTWGEIPLTGNIGDEVNIGAKVGETEEVSISINEDMVDDVKVFGRLKVIQK